MGNNMASFYTQSYYEYDTFVKEGNLYVNKLETYLNVRDEGNNFYHFLFKPGLVTDMGSIPSCLQWFIPSYDHDNVLLNLAYVAHDYCYASECLSKELADDLLRSVIRDAGYNRFHASTVCEAVKLFAKNHYGVEHDTHDCREYGELIVL